MELSGFIPISLHQIRHSALFAPVPGPFENRRPDLRFPVRRVLGIVNRHNIFSCESYNRPTFPGMSNRPSYGNEHRKTDLPVPGKRHNFGRRFVAASSSFFRPFERCAASSEAISKPGNSASFRVLRNLSRKLPRTGRTNPVPCRIRRESAHIHAENSSTVFRILCNIPARHFPSDTSRHQQTPPPAPRFDRWPTISPTVFPRIHGNRNNTLPNHESNTDALPRFSATRYQSD